MTYQNLGYWIGQANDTSTGRHPPAGWSSGQRWSATANQWMNGYDSMTAERDSWISAYNGKVSELAAMTANRDAWIANYNDMVNQRNAWINSSNAWQANANTAYTSGTWGSGETWQAAYNRVLPPGGISGYSVNNRWGANPGGNNMHDMDLTTWDNQGNGLFATGGPGGTTITCQKSGDYVMFLGTQITFGNNNEQWWEEIFVNSAQVGETFHGEKNPTSARFFVYVRHFDPGNYIQVRSRMTGGSTHFMDSRVWLYFVPTSTYPH